ncbi:cytochrome b-c1 complex subunit 8 [Phlyctochytrium arcticum]|nr:cytochrome b-c1 complex subunit 8 [Phlyctochytrium arcticum]
MGHKWWGNLSRQNGFYEYGLSPFQIRTMKGFFNPGAFNLMKRTTRQAIFIGPPALVFFAVKSWADKKFEYFNRKEFLLSPEHHTHH